MKLMYIFSMVIALSFAACTSTTSTQDDADEPTNEPAKDVAENVAENASAEFETVVITPDIPSPRKEMKGKELTVNYGSPSVKGRKLWGELVPYGEVWRTGANEATSITLSKDMKIQGKDLPAGKYGLFTIPAEDGKWTVIFNSQANQWGAYDYKADKDVLRVNATAETRAEVSETMDFVMENGKLVLRWDKLGLPIEFGM